MGKSIFNVSAVLEIIIGIILLVAPLFTINYLLGDTLSEVGIAATRVTGIALISLGVSAVEIFNQPIKVFTRIGLLVYNFAVAVLFLVLAIIFKMNGLLIWPTAGLHLIMGILIMISILKASQRKMEN